jgi:predicted NAD/FAD-binding protein/DUF1365 family protein
VSRRVAVVGSGVAGLTAAYVAHRDGSTVTLYEADDRLGGHADTHQVEGPDGTLAIDTGFIVHNERTYPTLLRMFAELGVATQESEMSMSTRDDATGLEWAGALGAAGLFPTWRNLARPAYLRMLGEIPRFHRAARAVLGDDGDDTTLRDFLDDRRFSAYFARHFMEPVVAAVWSCDPAVALDYPARYLFRFLDHHGMLGVFGSPPWKTVVGGSRSYVARVGALIDDVRLSTKVTSISETADGVEVLDGNGDCATYDAVVVATHPDQALSMLADPTPVQRELLSAIPYSANPALLHTDESLLPRARRARASWNFRRVADDRGHVTVTYDLTRLMRLPTATRYLVTLGGEDLVDPSKVIARREYAHPLYTPASVAAQARLGECDTDRIAFAGAYHGWGFHEDGARSGLAAAERLGLRWLRRDEVRASLVEEGALAPVSTPAGLSGGPGFETVASATSSTSEGAVSSTSERATSSTSEGAVSSTSERAPSPTSERAPSPTRVPGVYRTTITHTRRKPWKRTFKHRSYLWLVDLDHLPDHGVLGRFEARDHLGWPHATLRGNVTAFLARNDIDLTTAAGPGRILLAAHPRAFGHCFNPISVFWCFDGDGRPAGTVVEVHNTYGDRHAYLVFPDEQGRASTAKQMYVSPFHGVDGSYELAVPTPSDRLAVAVTLRSDDGAVFSASLTGERVAGAGRPTALRAAPAGIRGALLIRMHGVWLWTRRLRVQGRPTHHQAGVS